MAFVDPSTYGWLHDELAWFGVAGCVTVATDVSREEMADAFGADLAAPTRELHADEDQMLVSFAEIGDCQVAIEVNGYTGSKPEVLEALSRPGRAASAFWNVEDMIRFACAEDGSVLYDGEFVYDGTDGLPDELVPLVELVADDLEDEFDDSDDDDVPSYQAVALALVETFTGIRVSASAVEQSTRRGHPISD